MKPYIFGARNGIHIINLEITLACLEKVRGYVRELGAAGREILFVGTKKQAQDSIRQAAENCEMPYVNQRWLGGMLTNFETIRKSLGRLDAIDKMEEDGSFQYITKKERNSLGKEREKLKKNLEGIRNLRKLPGAIFVIDANKEDIAIREAFKLGIPVIAVVDSNCNPDRVEHLLPGNDDAIRAIRLFCDVIAESVSEGRAEFKKIAAAREAEEAAAKAAEEAAAQKEQAETEGAEETIEEDEDDEDDEVAGVPAAGMSSDGKTPRTKPRKPIKK